MKEGEHYALRTFPSLNYQVCAAWRITVPHIFNAGAFRVKSYSAVKYKHKKEPALLIVSSAVGKNKEYKSIVEFIISPNKFFFYFYNISKLHMVRL